MLVRKGRVVLQQLLLYRLQAREIFFLVRRRCCIILGYGRVKSNVRVPGEGALTIFR